MRAAIRDRSAPLRTERLHELVDAVVEQWISEPANLFSAIMRALNI